MKIPLRVKFLLWFKEPFYTYEYNSVLTWKRLNGKDYLVDQDFFGEH